MYLPFLAKALDYAPSPLAQCILCTNDDGSPVAGVVYDCYNEQTIHCHIWLDEGRMPMREWWAAIYDYPFNRLGVKKLIGQVKSGNEEAIKLDENMGFVLEAMVRDYYPTGEALLVYTMERHECRILNSPSWAKVCEKVARM
jgi:RimJ/RimL family protein N-acetyltransferase